MSRRSTRLHVGHSLCWIPRLPDCATYRELGYFLKLLPAKMLRYFLPGNIGPTRISATFQILLATCSRKMLATVFCKTVQVLYVAWQLLLSINLSTSPHSARTTLWDQERPRLFVIQERWQLIPVVIGTRESEGDCVELIDSVSPISRRQCDYYNLQ